MWYKEIFYRLAIFNWKDGIEILCITSGLYFFSVWLKHDKQKKLVPYFYAMCSFIIMTQLLELPTLSNTLISLCPAIIMLFILVHQNSLQKSFVALKNINPTKIIQSDWLETLLRSCLIAINNDQKIICLIEGHDSLSELVTTPFIINSKLQPNFLDTLITSSTYDSNKMIWLSDTGLLMGINTEWQLESKTNNKIDSKLDLWQQNSILFTAQTDTLTFRVNPKNRTFDIVMEGKLLEKMPTDQAIKLMHKHFRKKESKVINRNQNDKKNKSTNSKQPLT